MRRAQAILWPVPCGRSHFQTLGNQYGVCNWQKASKSGRPLDEPSDKQRATCCSERNAKPRRVHKLTRITENCSQLHGQGACWLQLGKASEARGDELPASDKRMAWYLPGTCNTHWCSIHTVTNTAVTCTNMIRLP
jgi:hypothetical protein